MQADHKALLIAQSTLFEIPCRGSIIYLRYHSVKVGLEKSFMITGISLGMILAGISFQNEQNLHKMVYIIPNFLFLHFGENFMKYQSYR